MNIIKPNLSFTKLDPLGNVDKIVQHHMAHPSWDVFDVHDYHKNTKGWNGIGYNYWVGFGGAVYECRGLHYGAGVRGHNYHTIHVGYQGDFTRQEMPSEQLHGGIEINEWLMKKLNLTANDVIGHNDLVATACPGKNFRMNELRKSLKGGKALLLRNGSKGNSVKNYQQDLIDLGYGEYLQPYGADGHFGSKTEGATRKFQQDHNLQVDGIAGQETLGKIEHLIRGIDDKGTESATFVLRGKKYRVTEI